MIRNILHPSPNILRHILFLTEHLNSWIASRLAKQEIKPKFQTFVLAVRKHLTDDKVIETHRRFSPQAALDVLTKLRLLEIAADLGLGLSPNQRKSELLGALSRAYPFRRILTMLRRDELKAICRAFSIADNGHEKATLTERILREGASKSAWNLTSDIISIAIDAGINPEPDKDLIDEISEMLLYPSKIEKSDDNSNWRLVGEPHLDSIDPPDELGLDRKYSVYSWDEKLDPIALMQTYLIRNLGAKSREVADRYIQEWLRSEFFLKNDDRTRFAIIRACDKVNQIFYRNSMPSRSDLHVLRSTTERTQYLVDRIGTAMFREEDSVEIGLNAETVKRLSLGICLFLRFCRITRMRYHWKKAGTKNGKNRGLCRHFASALSSVEPSYFLTRIFGVISSIPGFNFILRGGILPRTESGQTLAIIGKPGTGKSILALQLLVDVASRGGLAFYLSFEERYELIMYRLVTFGLINSSFSILGRDKEDLKEKISDRKKDEPDRGILVLYGESDESREFDLENLLDEIAGIGWQPLAVAIDSINALNLDAGYIESKPKEYCSEIFWRRQELLRLIDHIERNNFFGVITSEKDDKTFASISYLSDMIIEVGSEDNRSSRYMELFKSRGQNYNAGRHPFRLLQGRGIRVYPSLAAVRGALRRRPKTTLSQNRSIPLPLPVAGIRKLDKIAMKSSVLLHGPANSGKTRIALRLALEPGEDRNGNRLPPPRSVMVVTFRTTERHFGQMIENMIQRNKANTDGSGSDIETEGGQGNNNKEEAKNVNRLEMEEERERNKKEERERKNKEGETIARLWRGLKSRRLRWYSPGANFTAEQFISSLMKYIEESRRMGLPIERIVFDELESAEHMLPALKHYPLLWTTLAQLVASEAMTAIFAFSGEYGGKETEGEAFKALRLEMDYIFEIKKSEQTGRSALALQKRPDLREPNYRRSGGNVEKQGEEKEAVAREPLTVVIDGNICDEFLISKTMDKDAIYDRALRTKKLRRFLEGKKIGNWDVVPAKKGGRLLYISSD